MSWRANLALFLLILGLSFVRGYLALGPAGVLWRVVEAGPIPETTLPQIADSVNNPTTEKKEEPLTFTEAKVAINSAGLKELLSLPGVGPVLAERILAYRQEHGPFAALADVERVKGLGPISVQRLEPYLCFDDQ